MSIHEGLICVRVDWISLWLFPLPTVGKQVTTLFCFIIRNGKRRPSSIKGVSPLINKCGHNNNLVLNCPNCSRMVLKHYKSFFTTQKKEEDIFTHYIGVEPFLPLDWASSTIGTR